MNNALAKMEISELKARAYDLIAISQSVSEQLQVINNEIANRQQRPNIPAGKTAEQQMEIPLDKVEYGENGAGAPNMAFKEEPSV
jgi:hypothetical protein